MGIIRLQTKKHAQQIKEKEKRLLAHEKEMERRHLLQEKERMHDELEAAKAVQQLLLPYQEPHVKGYAIVGAYIPAVEVGGDFYQYYNDDQGGIYVVIGDVSGKGMKAAMLASLVLGALRPIVQATHDPSKILKQLNEVLCVEIHDISFITCLFGYIDPGTSIFTYANAGHLYPYYFSEKQSKWQEIMNKGNLPLGISPKEEYPLNHIQLEAGDTILLMSDGITEMRNSRKEMFGYAGLNHVLTECIAQFPHQMMSALLKKVNAFNNKAPQSDDITLVFLNKCGL